MKKVFKRIGIALLVIYLVLTTILLAGYMIESSVEEATPTGLDTSPSTISLTPVERKATEIDAGELLDITNKERADNGLKSLVLNESLNQSALNKCNDMVTNNYFSHNRPNGEEPWVFIKVDYTQAGENLAEGYYSARQVHREWMNSPTHKENILNKDYDNVGFGVCKSENFVGNGEKLIVVQHFIAR